MKDDIYEEEVRTRVIRALEDGFSNFSDVLSRVDGADPRLVRLIIAIVNPVTDDLIVEENEMITPEIPLEEP